MGYAVGAHDMLQAVVIAHRTHPEAAAGFLEGGLDCLNTLAAGSPRRHGTFCVFRTVSPIPV